MGLRWRDQKMMLHNSLPGVHENLSQYIVSTGRIHRCGHGKHDHNFEAKIIFLWIVYFIGKWNSWPYQKKVSRKYAFLCIHVAAGGPPEPAKFCKLSMRIKSLRTFGLSTRLWTRSFPLSECEEKVCR